MKHFLFAFVVAALLAGCTKASTTSAGTSDAAATAAATAAAAAATAAAAAATAAAAAATAAGNDTSTAAAATDTSAATTASASGAPYVPIEIPVYPGSTKEPDKSISMSSGGSSVKIDYYASSDSSETVVGWYKAHLPANWQNFTISSGAKTVGTFSSPEHGNDGQSVIVTGEDKGGSQIQVSTKSGA